MATVSAPIAALNGGHLAVSLSYDSASLRVLSVDLAADGHPAGVRVTVRDLTGRSLTQRQVALSAGTTSIDLRGLGLVASVGVGRDGQAGGLALPCRVEVDWRAT